MRWRTPSSVRSGAGASGEDTASDLLAGAPIGVVSSDLVPLVTAYGLTVSALGRLGEIGRRHPELPRILGDRVFQHLQDLCRRASGPGCAVGPRTQVAL